MSFTHTVRPRYSEIDMQGIVFNGRWLDYFDDACTRFFEAMGYDPKEAFGPEGEFDITVVKANLEWSAPARFDDEVVIAVQPTRLGTRSFDLTSTASVEGRTTCVGTITYVCIEPGGLTPRPLPDDLRERLEKEMS
jgi:acyl-CoA thioester hydrolase